MVEQWEQATQQNTILQRTASQFSNMQEQVLAKQLVDSQLLQCTQELQTTKQQVEEWKQACNAWQQDAQEKQAILQQAVKPLLVYLGNMNVTYQDASEMLWTDDALEQGVAHAKQVTQVLKRHAEEYETNMAHVRHKMEQLKLENQELQQRVQEVTRQMNDERMEREIVQTKTELESNVVAEQGSNKNQHLLPHIQKLVYYLEKEKQEKQHYKYLSNTLKHECSALRSAANKKSFLISAMYGLLNSTVNSKQGMAEKYQKEVLSILSLLPE